MGLLNAETPKISAGYTHTFILLTIPIAKQKNL